MKLYVVYTHGSFGAADTRAVFLTPSDAQQDVERRHGEYTVSALARRFYWRSVVVGEDLVT